MTTTPLPPDCARGYRALRRLASGGYGEVWEAEQIALGRRVAVKLLHVDMVTDAQAPARFEEEARITASLAHPNVIQVLDHGREAGQPWIAYELVPGRSLRELAESGVAYGTVLEAVAQVAAGLDAAHARGVLHRDIKPDNVLQAEDGRFKVADFGVAKWTRDGAVQTATGVIMGTPAYVAPEVISGEPASIASDVYALAVSAFELITGRLPFTQAALLEVLKAHLESEPPRASALRAGLPREVDQVFATALAKQPARRFASAGAFAEALTRASGAVSGVERARGPAADPAVEARARAGVTAAARASSRVAAPAASGVPPTAPISAAQSRPAPAPAGPSKWWLVGLAVFLASVGGVLATVALVYLRGVKHPYREPAPSASAALPSSSGPAMVDHLTGLRGQLAGIAEANDISTSDRIFANDPLKRWSKDVGTVRALYRDAISRPPVHESDYLVFAAPLAQMVFNGATILSARYTDRNHYADRTLSTWLKELKALGKPAGSREIVETLVVSQGSILLEKGGLHWDARCESLLKAAAAIGDGYSPRKPLPTEMSAVIALLHATIRQVTDVLWNQLEAGDSRDRHARAAHRLLTRTVVPALRDMPLEQRVLVADQDKLLEDLIDLSGARWLSIDERAVAGHSARSLIKAMLEVPAQRQMLLHAAERAASTGGRLATQLAWPLIDSRPPPATLTRELSRRLAVEWGADVLQLLESVRTAGRAGDIDAGLDDSYIKRNPIGHPKSTQRLTSRAQEMERLFARNYTLAQAKARELSARAEVLVPAVYAQPSPEGQLRVALGTLQLQMLCDALHLEPESARVHQALTTPGAGGAWVRHYCLGLAGEDGDRDAERLAAASAAAEALGRPVEAGEPGWAASWTAYVMIQLELAKSSRDRKGETAACNILDRVRREAPRVVYLARSPELCANLDLLLSWRQKRCNASDSFISLVRELAH